jgi:hypothetical protein
MKVLIHIVVLSIFTAGSLQLLLPVRYLIFVALFGLLCLSLWGDRSPSRSQSFAALFAPTIIAVTFVAMILFPVGNASAMDRLFRISFLLPLAVAVGVMIARVGLWSYFAGAFLLWASVFAGLAVVESIIGEGLFGRPVLEVISQTTYRSVVAAEHPLVLATLMLAAIPLALRARDRATATAALCILGWGIYTTQSSGPLGVMLAFLAGKAVAAVVPRWRGSFVAVFGVFALVLVAWLVLPGLGSSDTGSLVSSANSEEASIQYRFQLYSTMWHSLNAQPFGWGLDGLPKGMLLVRSSFGILDLARTVDSRGGASSLRLGTCGARGLYRCAIHALSQETARTALCRDASRRFHRGALSRLALLGWNRFALGHSDRRSDRRPSWLVQGLEEVAP